MADNDVTVKLQVDGASVAAAAKSSDTAAKTALREGITAQRQLQKEVIATAGRMQIFSGRVSSLLTQMTAGGPTSLLGAVGLVAAAFTTVKQSVENLDEQIKKTVDALVLAEQRSMGYGLSRTAQLARQGLVTEGQIAGAELGRAQAQQIISDLQDALAEGVAAKSKYGSPEKQMEAFLGGRMYALLPDELRNKAMNANAANRGDVLKEIVDYVDQSIKEQTAIYKQHDEVLKAHELFLKERADAEHKEGQEQLAREQAFSKQLQDDDKKQQDEFQSELGKVLTAASDQIDKMFEAPQQQFEQAERQRAIDALNQQIYSTQMPSWLSERIDRETAAMEKSYSSKMPAMTSLASKGIYMGEATNAMNTDPKMIVMRNIYNTTQTIAQELRS